jgi:dCTP deaminase
MSVLPDHALEALIAAGAITAPMAFDPDQVQPASLDLRLGSEAYRLRTSFLPNGRAVGACLADGMAMSRFSLTEGALLERGCIYLVPLQEQLRLPEGITGHANPKSSTGRVDVFVRVITDGGRAFDTVPAGYQGQLYAEISPSTFSIRVRAGERLCQLRLRQGGAAFTREMTLSVDLSGAPGTIVGFRARRHSAVLDLAHVGGHAPEAYWEPLRVGALGRLTPTGLILDPGEFYILASLEDVAIGLTEAAEMAAIAPEFGEFRAHYAGFFDPGFGLPPTPGRAVLEVRGHDVPFLLEHGQPVGRLLYEPLTAPPARPYGSGGNHYAGQRLKLSKHFAPWGELA